jgi:hypothetical protein
MLDDNQLAVPRKKFRQSTLTGFSVSLKASIEAGLPGMKGMGEEHRIQSSSTITETSDSMNSFSHTQPTQGQLSVYSEVAVIEDQVMQIPEVMYSGDFAKPVIRAPSDISLSRDDQPTRPQKSEYPKTVFGQQKRSFSKSIYAKYNFIEYSSERDAVFCYACRHFGRGESYGYLDPTFTDTGFCNWKKVDKIDKHVSSKYHCDSIVAMAAYASTNKYGTVEVQLVNHYGELVKENRAYVKSLGRIVLYCARQGISLRGHKEGSSASGTENRGNFLELVDLIKAESNEFKLRCESKAGNETCLSTDIQNTLLEAAARSLLSIIMAEVKDAGMYSVITDSCTDMVKDNLAVCIRYFDLKLFIIKERFIQFEELKYDELDANSIVEKILAVLEQKQRDFVLPLSQCVGQAADGAAVMSGKNSGVQNHLRNFVKNPCIFVHCYAHRLNLVLSSAACCIPTASEFFDLLKTTDKFINSSCKIRGLFSRLQTEAGKVELNLPAMCPHKWNYRERLVDVTAKRFPELMQCLQNISEKGTGTVEADAKGILKKWKQTTNISCLLIFSDIFSQMTPLSDTFQKVDIDLAATISLAKEHTKLLEQKRTEDYFKKLWNLITSLASENDVNLQKQGRKRKLPASFQHFHLDVPVRLEESNSTDDHEVHVRATLFYPIMDEMIFQMKRRFWNEETSPLLNAIAACNPRAYNFPNFEAIMPLATAYGIEKRGLLSQIDVCRNIIDALPPSKRPNNLIDVFHLLQPATGFPQLLHIFQLVLTLPIANVAAERSFSCMRRIRTYLRSTMTENRLSCLALLNIEDQLSRQIDLDTMVDIFAHIPSLRNAACNKLSDPKRRRLPL